MFVPEVTRPLESVVTLLYVPAVPTAASVGLGYVPVRSPPAEVEDVTNEPLVGSVTPLIDVMLVGVALKPKVIPVVPPSHVVPELNAKLEFVNPSP
jgi:hypothetical protein